MDDPWISVRKAYGRARRLGVAKVSLTGKVEDCNEAFANILGGDRLSIIGKNVITDLTWPQDRELTQKRFAELSSGRTGVVSSQKQSRQINGKAIDVYIEACLVINAERKPAYVIDAIWEAEWDQETESAIQKFEAMIAMLRAQMGSGPQINITGADMTHNTNSHNTAGGDVTGRDKVTNNTKAIRYLAGAIGAMVVLGVWAFYYIATVSNGTTPQPPETQPTEPEQPPAIAQRRNTVN